MPGVLIKRGNLDTDMHRGVPCEIGATTSQGTSRSSETGLEQVLLQHSKRDHGPINLDSDFRPLEL